MFVGCIASYRMHHENDTLTASREYHFAPDLFSIIYVHCTCYVYMPALRHHQLFSSLLIGAIDCMMPFKQIRYYNILRVRASTKRFNKMFFNDGESGMIVVFLKIW